MPNHITNRLTIIGDKAEIARVFSEIKGEMENQFIDFNKIVPLPTELDNTKSPMSHITQKEYEEQEHKIANNELTEDEKRFGLSRCLTIELSIEYKRKFGADNWYSWQTQNWGTKWNASDVIVSEDSVFFNTAWSTPEPIFVALSMQFTEVVISVRFADEDFGYNVGEFSLLNGNEVDSNIPKGGTEEAYRLAYDIQGGSDYYTWDMFFDIEEDEDIDDNNYYKVMIKISYEENKAVDEEFPTNVLNEFLSLALADENFELAKEIRDILKAKEESGEEA